MGLAEDITKKVGVKARLLATIFSGLIACLLTGYSLGPVELPGIDQLLAYWPISLLVTAFAVGGIANAINIIDGVNGLASGTVMIILTGFAVLSWIAGDSVLLSICLVILGGIGGFFVLNFPLGKIFFGDAGAYTAGFLLAVLAVILPLRNPEISPVCGLLALGYPVIETMVSIHRRTVRQGTNPGQPDRLHLHSLVFRDLARRLANAIGAPAMRNPMTSVLVWFLPLLSVALMLIGAHSSLACWIGLALLTMVYLAYYRRVAILMPLLRQVRARLLRSGDTPANASRSGSGI